MNKKAFTLAEVLVTLMVIGVIAAMTIPGLRKSAEQRENVAGLKKAYATLSNAIALAEQENGPRKRWGSTDADTVSIFNNIKAYMNVTKECINSTGCLGDGKVYQLNGDQYTSITNKGYGSPQTSFITADGMSWIYDLNPNNFDLFFVDVNGSEKKPNTLGYDVFMFYWYYASERGLYPAGTYAKNWGNCNSTGSGLDCAARVLREGAINY